jgi:uncharacterized protein YkwD
MVFRQINNKNRIIFITLSICLVITLGFIYIEYNRPVKSIPLANESNSSQSSAVSIDTSLSTKNAFNRINETRKNLGLTVLTENALLDTTAQKSVQLLASNTTDSSQKTRAITINMYLYLYYQTVKM